MKLVPRSHKGELSSLDRFRQEFDRMLENFWGGGFDLESFSASGQWLPRLDVSETDDAIQVQVDVPGIQPKEIDISVTGNMLTVKGERKEEHETKEKTLHRVERSYGSFSRTVTLPTEVDVEKISASAKEGVLSITLPKREEAKARQIKVEVK